MTTERMWSPQDCGCELVNVNGFWVRDSALCSSTHSAGVIKMEPVKPGWKTTEFWLAAAAAIVALVQTGGIVGEGTPASGALGLVAAALASLGYSWSRAKAKSGG